MQILVEVQQVKLQNIRCLSNLQADGQKSHMDKK